MRMGMMVVFGQVGLTLTVAVIGEVVVVVVVSVTVISLYEKELGNTSITDDLIKWICSEWVSVCVCEREREWESESEWEWESERVSESESERESERVSDVMINCEVKVTSINNIYIR